MQSWAHICNPKKMSGGTQETHRHTLAEHNKNDGFSPFVVTLFRTIVPGASRISDLRGPARVTKRETVDPLGIGLGFTPSELDKVSSAILGREQLGVTDVDVENPGGLDVLDAQAGSVTFEVVERGFLAGVVENFHVVVSQGEGSGGHVSQQSE